jgi:Peptidase family M23
VLLLGLLILTHLILPLVFLLWLWRGKEPSKLDWLVKLLLVMLYSLHIFLSGRWDMLSYSLRFALVVLCIGVAIKSFIKAKPLPLYPPRKLKNYLTLGVNSVVAVFFLAIVGSYVPHGYAFSGEAIQLSFPLKMGTYYVGHGGNSPVINYHNVNPTQRYALDIVELNSLGRKANGLQPRLAQSATPKEPLTNYVIFEQTLYSPCNGTISDTVNNLPDLIPPERDRQNLAGNHILMNCKGADVLMAHLQSGSITVQAGDAVREGQAIARVGNSGNTSEPHLHIHARKENTGKSILDGEGMPITFDSRFLVRNSLFNRRIQKLN